MGCDSVCDTGIMLGLSLNSSPSTVNLNTMRSTKKPCLSIDQLNKGVIETVKNFEPSLTLSLSGIHRDHDKIHAVGACISDSSGGCSSFSNQCVKREREVVSEESERVSNDDNYSGVINTSVDDVKDDDDYVNGRKKLRLTKSQSALLEEAFKHHNSLNLQKQKQELARGLKLRTRQVEVWFQNRRARAKLKQTEMDFQHLKELCDKLTCDNRKLQKELHELKAMKSSQPFHTAARTITVCQWCERICSL